MTDLVYDSQKVTVLNSLNVEYVYVFSQRFGIYSNFLLFFYLFFYLYGLKIQPAVEWLW